MLSIKNLITSEHKDKDGAGLPVTGENPVDHTPENPAEDTLNMTNHHDEPDGGDFLQPETNLEMDLTQVQEQTANQEKDAVATVDDSTTVQDLSRFFLLTCCKNLLSTAHMQTAGTKISRHT